MECGLTMTQRETEAVIVMLDTCEEPIEVEAERTEGIAGTGTSGRANEGEATATPTLPGPVVAILLMLRRGGQPTRQVGDRAHRLPPKWRGGSCTTASEPFPD